MINALGDRVLLRHVPTRRLHHDLELVGLHERIITQLEAERRLPFELLDQVLLVLEYVKRDIRVYPHDERILAPFEGGAADRPLDATSNGFRREHASGAVA